MNVQYDVFMVYCSFNPKRIEQLFRFQHSKNNIFFSFELSNRMREANNYRIRIDGTLALRPNPKKKIHTL